MLIAYYFCGLCFSIVTCSLFVPLDLNWVSYIQNIIRSCFFKFSQAFNVLIRKFNPLLFEVITDRKKLAIAISTFSLAFWCLFLFCFIVLFLLIMLWFPFYFLYFMCILWAFSLKPTMEMSYIHNILTWWDLNFSHIQKCLLFYNLL